MKNEGMSKVDRKQKERLDESKKKESKLKLILQEYINTNYPDEYNLENMEWLKQFHLWGEIFRKGLNLSNRPPLNPTVFIKDNSIGLTNNNAYIDNGQIQVSYLTDNYSIKWKKLTGQRLGLEPDCTIQNLNTQKIFMYEIKTQQNKGNAHERGYRYLVPSFVKIIHIKMGIMYYPFAIAITGDMSRDTNYVREWKVAMSEYPNHLIVWADTSNTEIIINHFEEVVKPLID